MNPILLYAMLTCGCALGALASYFFKGASVSLDGLNVFALLREKQLWYGGLLYLIAAVNNIFLLGYMEYSILLPMSSLTYIWTMVFANRLLGEKITVRKWVGVAAIICGAALLANG